MARRQIAVLGAGVLGLVLASRLQSRTTDVTILAVRPHASPTADSQRNHGWHQSGLLYALDGAAHPPYVLAMQASGDRLKQHVGVGTRGEPAGGVFAVREGQADAMEAAIRALGLGARASRLTGLRRDALSSLVGESRICFRVPDGPFDESEVLTRLLRMATGAGARFFEADHELVLDISGDRACVRVAGSAHHFDALVVAAGAGTKTALASIGVQADVEVSQSALLRVADGARHLSEDLFVDMESGLSIVKHGDSLVIGGRFRRRIEAPDMAARRSVTDDERRELLNIVPTDIAKAISPMATRWTAGYKTELRLADGTTRVAPWILYPAQAGVANLYAALPGKATSAWYVADELIQAIDEFSVAGHNSEEFGTIELGETGAPGRLHMHYEQHYAGMDESKTP